jgi:hypothetical protein
LPYPVTQRSYLALLLCAHTLVARREGPGLLV